MNYIDFHCHLDFKDFDTNRKEIIDQCFNSGLSTIITVADPYQKDSFERTAETLQYNSRILCMAGAHPHNADKYTNEIEKGMIAFIEKHHAVGFGETGLDFHYNFSSPDNQRRVFKRQIAIAQELQLPLIIHSRIAEQDVLQILEESKFDRPVVFHCYTGNIKDAEEIVKRGYYISISGIVTFKKSEELRDVVRILPLDRIFTETDSPFLAPVPFRGETNNPLHVIEVAQKVAEIKNIPVEELNRHVNENLKRIIP
ncbi:MAG: TatD family hydrolase [Candidatus Omnitrophota bacterium]